VSIKNEGAAGWAVLPEVKILTGEISGIPPFGTAQGKLSRERREKWGTRQATADSSLASPSKARLRTSLGMTKFVLLLA
jgi:hypothetical protein